MGCGDVERQLPNAAAVANSCRCGEVYFQGTLLPDSAQKHVRTTVHCNWDLGSHPQITLFTPHQNKKEKKVILRNGDYS